MSDLVKRLRNHALPDPHDEREVMHAPLLKEVADRIAALEAKVRELEAENFALSAGSCCEIDGLTADEGGVIYCRKVKQLAASRQQVERLLNASAAQLSLANKDIDAYKKLECLLIDALLWYANKAQWSGLPWKLLFDSNGRDGDGWVVAEEALTAIEKERHNDLAKPPGAALCDRSA